MGNLLTIDPGKKSVAFAIFDGNDLATCGFLLARERAGLVAQVRETLAGQFFDDVVIELPKVYQQRRWSGDPNDLIHLAVTVGIIVSMYPKAALVLAREWKGTTPKAVMNTRTEGRLSEIERSRLSGVCSSRHRHNVLDAIGIGLWRLGRL